jgi:predicted TIM-barrel fold metal-dependent hydrolase
MLGIYEVVFNAGLIILFHSGVDYAFKEPFFCTPKRLGKVLDAFPAASMVAAHMGGYRYWDDVEDHLLGRNIYFDTAYSIHELGKERAETFIRQHGAEKVLFGTDSPWRDPAMDISIIKSLDFSNEEINGILGNNAKKLLELV